MDEFGSAAQRAARVHQMEQRQKALFEVFAREILAMKVPGTELNLLTIAPESMGHQFDGFMGMSSIERAATSMAALAARAGIRLQYGGVIVQGENAAAVQQAQESAVRVTEAMQRLAGAVRRAITLLPSGGYGARLVLLRALGVQPEKEDIEQAAKSEREAGEERRRKAREVLNTLLTGADSVDETRIVDWVASKETENARLKATIEKLVEGAAP